MTFRFLFVLMIAFSPFAHAQWGVNAVMVNPTAERDYVLKTGFGGGILYSSISDDSQLYVTFSINYINHQYERDTFYTYGFTNNLNGSGEFGYGDGYETYKSYTGWQLGSRIDYRLFDRDFSPTIGADVAFITEDFTYDYKSIGVEGSGDEGIAYAALAPSIGVSYLFEDFHFFLHTNYQLMITRGSIPKQWLTSLGVAYIF